MAAKLPNRKFLNDSGFSLIEIIMAAGIMGVIALAMSTMFVNMIGQSRALNEKIASLETFRFVTEALSDSRICKSALTLPTPISFDSANPPASISIPSGQIALGTNSYAAKVGEVSSPTAQSLVVSTLDLVNIQNAGFTDSWSGELQVGFEKSKLVRALRPLTVRLSFQTDPTSPASAKIVKACGVAGVVDFNDCYFIDQYLPEHRPPVTVDCNPGYTLVFGTGVRDGSQDPVGPSNFSMTATSIRIFADRDNWRMLGKCCRM